MQAPCRCSQTREAYATRLSSYLAHSPLSNSGPSAVDRENLSPFTKDFRAEGHTMSMNSLFGIPSKERDTIPDLQCNTEMLVSARKMSKGACK